MDEDADLEQAHEKRYTESRLGSHVAYHFTINAKGEVKQNRSPNERSGHTRNQAVNLESIAIVLTGNLHEHDAPKEQIEALKALIKKLDALYTFKEIVPHGYASPSACPGKYVIDALKDVWRYAPETVYREKTFLLSRYYTPVPGQDRYYRNTYEEDFEVNCQGNCFSPADGGVLLTDADAYKIAACPKSYPLGTKLNIEGIGIVTCRDRGGAIKEEGNLVRLDIYAGVGSAGLDRVRNGPLPHHPKVVQINP